MSPTIANTIAGVVAILALLLALVGAFALWWIYGPKPAGRIDWHTGRPFGDHGTAEQAIEWALEHDNCHDTHSFLEAWNEGTAWEEWPEFYTWLAEQAAARHRRPA